MKQAGWTFAALLGCITQSSAFPNWRNALAERAVAADVAPQADVVLSSHSTLEELAKELFVDFYCLSDANPLLSHLKPGDRCYVPYHCCKTSCKGFCSARPQCHGQSTSTAAPQPKGTTTTCLTTITTSIPSPTATFSIPVTTGVSPTDSAAPSGSPSSSPATASTGVIPPPDTSSAPFQNVTSSSSSSAVASTGVIPSQWTSSAPNQNVTSSSSIPVVASISALPSPDTSSAPFQNLTSSSSSLPSASNPSASALPGTGTAHTNTLSASVTATNSGSGNQTSSTAAPPTESGPGNGTATISSPPGTTTGTAVVTTTDSLGQTIISDTSGAVTIPSGLNTSSLVTLPDGSVVTFQPTTLQPTPPITTPGVVTTTDSLGQTVISDTSGAVTIPSGLNATSLITLPDGTVVTFEPTASPPIPTASISGVVTTTNSVGQTVISDTSGAVTIPSDISTASVVTLPDGSIITFSPIASPTGTTANGTTTSAAPPGTTSVVPPPIVTTTNSDGLTIISDSSGAVTLPTGITTGSVITLPDGSTVSFVPTASPTATTSDIPTGLIFPVTTSVDAPKATDDGSVIPCNLWFFNICIDWIDIDIGGWEFNFPEGIRPPGPPPPITFPPELSITVGISGTIPPWPSLTIGPDHVPTFEPEPDNCETESAELCLTSTSFGVDTATVTTASSVLSTCATVFGCDVSDSAASTSSTASATSTYLYSCTAGCAVCTGGIAKRALPAATGTSALALSERRDVVAHAQVSELAERDIPSQFGGVSPSEFYTEEIGDSPNTVRVPLTNSGLTLFSTSVYEPFVSAEKNIYVTGLRGCTSVAVVSRRGAWVSHFWEPAFAIDKKNADRFQTDVLGYLESGRAGEAGTQPLLDVTQSGIFADTGTTKIFIMTPATYDRDLLESREERTVDGITIPAQVATPENEQTASLQNSDPQPLFDGTTTLASSQVPDRLTPLKNQLAEILPGVAISLFTYRRQQDEGRVQLAAYGKMAVLYSNNQQGDPDNPLEDIGPPQQAVWECWMQDFKIGSDQWDALPAQETPCGGQSGNQKRQDGGACSLSATATSTSAPTSASPSSQPITSTSSVPVSQTIATTSSGPVSINPSDLPTLSCSVPQPTETGVFYLFTESYRECSEGGLCSDAQTFAGLATEEDWNAGCDFFTGTAGDLFTSNTLDSDPYPPNENFTLENTGAYCNTNPLTFDLQCDGSWIVGGEGQGGVSHCTTASLPATSTADCTDPSFPAQVTAVLACTGAICQAPPADPSTTAEPSPTCVPPTTEGTGKFYLFDEPDPLCTSLGGCSTRVAGIATPDDWNEDFLASDNGYSDNDIYGVAYPSGGDDPNNPDTYTLEDTNAYCNTNALTFNLQCDGSYVVSGAGQGGSSICTHDIPDGVEDTIEVGSKGFAYLALVCTGDICS